MVYRQHFKVQGSGEFPFDMLRYDHCWPVFELESAHLAIDMNSENYFKTREVSLARDVDDKKRVPTADRWSSFGWKVIPGSVLTEKRGR